MQQLQVNNQHEVVQYLDIFLASSLAYKHIKTKWQSQGAAKEPQSKPNVCEKGCDAKSALTKRRLQEDVKLRCASTNEGTQAVQPQSSLQCNVELLRPQGRLHVLPLDISINTTPSSC